MRLNGTIACCSTSASLSVLFQLSDVLAPRDLQGPILVDATGMPRYWATAWSTLSTAQLADSTHIKKLRGIEYLYQHADNLLGSSALDNALGSLDEFFSFDQ